MVPDSDALQGWIKAAANWPFMQEPIWRWFLFLVITGLFMNVWRGIQDHMK